MKKLILSVIIVSLCACGTKKACKVKRGYGSMQKHSWGAKF
jgi:hypothetical protein